VLTTSKSNSTRRDEFSATVKEALGKRASYVCSRPDCRALTIAPADADVTEVLYIGKAGHICAAAPGGPRYDQSMTPGERCAIHNAIFLCSSCADMVDKNGGADFPVAKLREWKQQHEQWVRANLNKRMDAPLAIIDGTHEAHGVGNVTGLDIQGPAHLKPGTRSFATGIGNITGTRIGGPPREE
jgi:hypothetical protein